MSDSGRCPRLPWRRAHHSALTRRVSNSVHPDPTSTAALHIPSGGVGIVQASLADGDWTVSTARRPVCVREREIIGQNRSRAARSRCSAMRDGARYLTSRYICLRAATYHSPHIRRFSNESMTVWQQAATLCYHRQKMDAATVTSLRCPLEKARSR